MNGSLGKLSRCAIYTRKSTEHNLDLAFSSLDAQREACEAYIKSQAGEGWRLISDHYDDGGHEISALKDRHRAVDCALSPAGHTGQRRFGGTAECNAVRRRQRAGQAGNQYVGIGIVGDRHGRAPSRLRKD
jgi:hypothetical protein